MDNDEEVKKENEKTYIECPKCERRVEEREKVCPYCQYDLENKPKIEKEEKIFYKQWWFWTIVVIILIVFFFWFVSIEDKNTYEIANKTNSSTTNKTNNTANKSTNQTKVANNNLNASAIENTTKNISDEPKGEDIVLTLGTYEVGIDINAGKYDLIAQSGMGNVITKGSTHKSIMLSINETEYYSIKYNNLTLRDGDEIEIINKLKVLFQAK